VKFKLWGVFMADDVKRFQDEINKIFSSVNFSDLGNLRLPFTSIKETEKNLEIRFEMPGMNKEDIQLKLTDDTIEINAEQKAEKRVEKKNYFSMEQRAGRFYKTMSLPCKVVPEQSKASYKNGVLEVIVPKKEMKKVKKIEIK